MRRRIRVPGTSANLGPGFDSFGLALDLWNEVLVDTESSGVTWEGEGADELPTDGSDMISRAFASAWGAADAPSPSPTVSIHGINRIPLERGLGSSSAAAVAGIAAACALRDDVVDLHEVFARAAEFEGHPDNAAPAVYGGFTIVYGGDGPPIRLDPASTLRPVVLIPEEIRLATEAARAALSRQVSLEDAIFNAAHAAALVVALTGGDARLLQEALVDRLHQQVRLALVPPVQEVFELVGAQGVPVCVSGAGPTLLAFEVPDGPTVPDLGAGWTILRPAVAATGLEVIDD